MGKRFRVTRIDILETEENEYNDLPIDSKVIADALGIEAVLNQGSSAELVDPNNEEMHVICNYTATNEKLEVEELP